MRAGDDDKGPVLLAVARAALTEALGEAPPETALPDWLERPGASFVTLRLDGELRGCIGSLEPHRSLGEDVGGNAVAAGLRDPRFPPLAPAELDRVRIEVSLLSPLSPIACADEADLLRRLRPGVDGLVFEHDGRRGTFLPAVWRQLPRPDQFLRRLKRKAGLAADFWAPDVRVSRYTVESWAEPAA